jgi:hypothetical protein
MKQVLLDHLVQALDCKVVYQPSKSPVRKDMPSLDWSFPKMKQQSYPLLLVAQLYLSVKANILYMVESHTVKVNTSVLFKRSITARMVAVVMTMTVTMIKYMFLKGY